MKRFHVHLRVYDIEANIRFYSSLFGVRPSMRGPRLVQWVLENPALVLTVSARGSAPGLELLGLHADSDEELAGLRRQFARADGYAIEEPAANDNGSAPEADWVIDPQGILWRVSARAPASPPRRKASERKTDGAQAGPEETPLGPKP